MADFNLKIYTQEKKVYDGSVTAVTAPGEEGYFGVLANHAPLLATLGSGRLVLRTGEKIAEHNISGGFLEVHSNECVILADSLD